MTESSALSRSVEALNQYFLGDATMAETLTRVSRAAVIAAPQAQSVGITMMVDGTPGTYVFTDPEMPEIDRAQYESGRGPCVDAWRDGTIYSIPDTRTDIRWPEFSAVADGHGVRSTLSVPMIAGDRSLGAMNLYSPVDHGFEPEDHRNVEVFASQAAFLLANAQALWDSRSLSENLQAALDAQVVVEQAKGVIMAGRGGTPDEALDTLIALAQSENRNVREVAAEIVRTRLR